MADPIAEGVAAVDEFAQTRGADDLFDDEIIPVSGEQQIHHVDEPPTEEPKPAETVTQDQSPARRPRGQGREGAPSERGRSRGRGRGRGARGGLDIGTKSEAIDKEDKTESEAKDPGSSVHPESQATEEKQDDDNDGNDNKTTGKAETARVQAVRGDRSGTGGVKKPKLSEEELAERMAAAKLNAAKKAAAHARAEADEASFQERERVAAQKRRQELVNRKVMDNERERNRMRKLGAQTGREWDAEKKEEDYNGRRGGGSQYRRGMHGGVAGFPRRENDDHVERSEDSPGPRGRGRGRGGRGRGRGGRGARGDFSNRDNNSTTPESQSAPGIDKESEFPALPGSLSKNDEGTSDKLQTNMAYKLPPLGSPSSPAEGTWADQVDLSESK